jgi:hypothetical protein
MVMENAERFDRFDEALAKGWLIRDQWTDEKRGREYACALAQVAPETRGGDPAESAALSAKSATWSAASAARSAARSAESAAWSAASAESAAWSGVESAADRIIAAVLDAIERECVAAEGAR